MTGGQKILAVDDSLLICKEIKKALGDEVFICEAHNIRFINLTQRRRHWNYWRR